MSKKITVHPVKWEDVQDGAEYVIAYVTNAGDWGIKRMIFDRNNLYFKRLTESRVVYTSEFAAEAFIEGIEKLEEITREAL